MEENKEPIQELISQEALPVQPKTAYELDLSKFKFDLRDNSHIQAFAFYVANKALEKYNTSLDQIHHNDKEGKVEGTPWFLHYTFETEKEYLTWKKFVYKCLREQARPKISNANVNTYVKEIEFLYGLRKAYLD